MTSTVLPVCLLRMLIYGHPLESTARQGDILELVGRVEPGSAVEYEAQLADGGSRWATLLPVLAIPTDVEELVVPGLHEGCLAERVDRAGLVSANRNEVGEEWQGNWFGHAMCVGGVVAPGRSHANDEIVLGTLFVVRSELAGGLSDRGRVRFRAELAARIVREGLPVSRVEGPSAHALAAYADDPVPDGQSHRDEETGRAIDGRIRRAGGRLKPRP